MGKKVISVSLCLTLLTGCGTIMHGNKQLIKFTSKPPGARVLIDGEEKGITPCEISMSRAQTTTLVVLRKTGYEDYLYTLHWMGSGWAWASLAIPIVGPLVDVISGSWGADYEGEHHLDLVEMDEMGETKKDPRVD